MIRDCDCAYGSNDLKSGEITTSPSHCSVSSGHINEPEVNTVSPVRPGEEWHVTKWRYGSSVPPEGKRNMFHGFPVFVSEIMAV